LSKVVLPLPRKPVITETGSRAADLSGSNNPILISNVTVRLPAVPPAGLSQTAVTRPSHIQTKLSSCTSPTLILSWFALKSP